MQTVEEKIEIAKFEATRANAIGDQDGLSFWIAELDNIWHDNHAAMAFYTMLENTRPETV